MTKEELKHLTSDCEYFLNGRGEINLYNFIENLRTTYIEPKEKQIQIDAEQIRALQKQNGELTDKVKGLEVQLAKSVYLMRELMIDIDTPAYGYAVSQANKFIKEIKEK